MKLIRSQDALDHPTPAQPHNFPHGNHHTIPVQHGRDAFCLHERFQCIARPYAKQVCRLSSGEKRCGGKVLTQLLGQYAGSSYVPTIEKRDELLNVRLRINGDHENTSL